MWPLLKPLMFMLPAERAHYFAMGAYASVARFGIPRRLVERLARVDDPRLESTVCGLRFQNPVGLAAGFDKDARWFHLLDSLGFGSIEIGSITGQGQPGNPRPRLFRLPQDEALINRMGFNNQGAEVAARNLAKVDLAKFRERSVLGINLGKTKVIPNEQANEDYAFSFRLLFPFADYFVINVSSPNTPGLRSLQEREPLISLLQSIDALNENLAGETGSRRRPVFLKIAPDLTNEQIVEISEIAAEPFVSGIIATNTTISRENLKTSLAAVSKIGAGGLSGRPLFGRSCSVVRLLYERLQGQKPVIGVGGIFNGDDAWNMLTSGASLVQLYTGFVYGGPTVVRKINRSLLQKLSQFGLDSISQAVGMDVKNAKVN
jgi:dihydroorotate dehydrogenase